MISFNSEVSEIFSNKINVTVKVMDKNVKIELRAGNIDHLARW